MRGRPAFDVRLLFAGAIIAAVVGIGGLIAQALVVSAMGFLAFEIMVVLATILSTTPGDRAVGELASSAHIDALTTIDPVAPAVQQESDEGIVSKDSSQTIG